MVLPEELDAFKLAQILTDPRVLRVLRATEGKWKTAKELYRADPAARSSGGWLLSHLWGGKTYQIGLQDLAENLNILDRRYISEGYAYTSNLRKALFRIERGRLGIILCFKGNRIVFRKSPLSLASREHLFTLFTKGPLKESIAKLVTSVKGAQIMWLAREQTNATDIAERIKTTSATVRHYAYLLKLAGLLNYVSVKKRRNCFKTDFSNPLFKIEEGEVIFNEENPEPSINVFDYTSCFSKPLSARILRELSGKKRKYPELSSKLGKSCYPVLDKLLMFGLLNAQNLGDAPGEILVGSNIKKAEFIFKEGEFTANIETNEQTIKEHADFSKPLPVLPVTQNVKSTLDFFKVQTLLNPMLCKILARLHEGQTTAPVLSSEIGIDVSNLYKRLDNLIAAGFVVKGMKKQVVSSGKSAHIYESLVESARVRFEDGKFLLKVVPTQDYAKFDGKWHEVDIPIIKK